MITRFKASNFTVFTDLNVDFTSGINIFIGQNGTGKTHLLKAVYSACCLIDKKMDITHLIEPICIAGFILTVLILPFVEGLLAWAGILIVYLVINILKNKSILIRRKK
jgi:predicted ATP-dependent endonuclease of OLD family